MTKRTSHKPQKNWRRIVGMLAVFAVILGGLTMAQPRQARAVCETPASAIATLGLWLADSLGLLGDFGGALQDYLIADVETGQDEIEKRIDDFDYHTRQGWGEWWQGNNGALQNMRDQSKQLSTATMDETRMRGSMMDADASAEREADIQKVANDVNNDNDIALNACTADSVLGGGGDGSGGGSSRPGSCSFNGMNVANGWRGSFSDACSNAPRTRGFRECCDGTVYTHYTSICGQDQPDVQANCSTGSTSGESGNAGMVFSVEASNDVTRALAKDASTRAVAAKDTPEEKGIPAVIKDKWEKSMVYCDPDANGGTMPCPAGTDPELINKDIEVGSALLWGDSMTIDINDEKFATMMQDAERAFVDQTPAAAIPENMLNQPPAIKQFNMTRSTAARKQAVHAVIGGLMGTRVARPDIEPMTEVQDIRKSAGVPDANTTDKPSVHEITQALFQERYTKPEFVTQIVQDPEQLVKENLDIQSGYLMQWNMMYKNMEKLAVMYASEFAQDLEDSEPDFVANRGTDPFDGSRFTVDSDNDGEIEECEIVNFEIPTDPFETCVEGGSDLDVSGWPTSPSTGQISDAMREKLKEFEGYSNVPYWDFQQWSICYGNRLPEPYRPGISYSDAQCDALLSQQLSSFENYVRNATSHCTGMTQNQFDALVSFTYNTGYNLTNGSGMADLISACDFNGAAVKMQEYNIAGGEVNSHLVQRRAAEAAIMTADTGGYTGGCVSDGLYCGAGATDPLCSSDWGSANSAVARCISQRDDASLYYCAKGVANILQEMGYPVTRGNASDWDDGRMEANGWTKIDCQPSECPAGAVLHFDNNAGAVCGVTGSRGADCGHVEIVTETNGTRTYVSDEPRTNAGGSVPQNYTGAYIYTGPIGPVGSIAQQCIQ